MNLTEAMKGRHSVRQYTDQPLNEAVISALQKEIDACNQESGLHIQLVTNEPKAFDGFMAHSWKIQRCYGLYRNDWKERSHPG